MEALAHRAGRLTFQRHDQAIPHRVPRVMSAALTAVKGTTKAILGASRRPIARANFRRAVKEATGPLRLNVGSGGIELPGWLNTDVGFRAKMYLDITRPWPVPSGSVGYVFADNVVEHLPLESARAFFRHALVALAPGGILRLATPDVERTARIYLDDPATVALHMERHRRAGYQVNHSVDLLRITFATNGHETGYLWDMASMVSELTAAGYAMVARRETGESLDPVLCGLERRSGPTERQTSLVIEAKPR
jgi:predicted SAM-dependent methyltransferase